MSALAQPAGAGATRAPDPEERVDALLRDGLGRARPSGGCASTGPTRSEAARAPEPRAVIVLNASFSFAQELHAERATDGSVELDLPPLTGESQPVTRYVPPLHAVFHAAALSATDVAVLAGFAVIVWAADEVRRWWMRRGHRSR